MIRTRFTTLEIYSGVLNWQSYIQSGGGYASDKEYNDTLFSLQHVINLLVVVCLFFVFLFFNLPG